MQQLSIQSLDVYFEKLLKKIPEERAALFKRLEPQLVDAVRGVVGGKGKVKNWQVGSLGDYGGYAAVHPKPKTEYKGYAVGRVTNAITSGHKISGKEGGWVAGKHYYEDAQPLAKEILRQEMEKTEKRIKEVMEG